MDTSRRTFFGLLSGAAAAPALPRRSTVAADLPDIPSTAAPESSRANRSNDEPTKPTRQLFARPGGMFITGTSDICAFSSDDDPRSSFSTLCEYFSISNPSGDDIMFLLFARRDGVTRAIRLAEGLGLKCDSARAAAERFAR